MAIINSTSKLIEILKIDGDFSLFINEVFVKEYNWFINNYYIHKNIPLLEYINISGIHLYYEDILINKENSKKLLRMKFLLIIEYYLVYLLLKKN